TFAGTLPTGAPAPAQGYQTQYTYDAMGDLVSVSQDVNEEQTGRSFSYDSQKRLLQAINPESGTTSYTYDANGNVKTKTDLRSPSTPLISYTYDSLNRITSKTYADTTPTVLYTYDGVGVSGSSNALGRLSTVSSSVSESEYTSYDPVGRVTGYVQETNNQPYTMSYTYDLAGHTISEVYPSGRTVNTQYDQVGRLSQESSGNTTYESQLEYAPFGGLTNVTLGNSLAESTQYNARLQPTSTQLGSSGGLFNLTYSYGSANNGNVLGETLTVGSNTWAQTYSYDNLNRLATAAETYSTSPSSSSPPAQTWSRGFNYDAMGNMWVNPAQSSGIGIAPATPQAFSAFTPSTNRLAGGGYDQAGNLTTDLVGNSYTYDAENKQTSCTVMNETTGASTSATYTYDGDGQRITKNVGGTVTMFVYNADGALVAEYGGPALTDSGTSYLTTDQLGSTRLVTDANQNVRRHDFLPYGEEINTTAALMTTGRSNVAGYVGSDDLRQRFTSKERDPESDLDYYGLRYCSSVEGRFTSPDTIIIPEQSKKGEGAYLLDPRNWNKYVYVSDNPLLYVDDDGAEGGLHYEVSKDGTPTVKAPQINPKAGYVMGATAAVGLGLVAAHFAPEAL
ncbi:MAG TPA: RHS repeat-associated core domain-containing protein, partial [Blastocatellia bacterium]